MNVAIFHFNLLLFLICNIPHGYGANIRVQYAVYKPGRIALDLTQTVILTRNSDGTYNFQFICPVANSIITFTPGVELELGNADGLKIVTLITIEDNIMTHIQSVTNGEYVKTTKYVREFYADKMISTFTDERTKKIEKRHYFVEK